MTDTATAINSEGIPASNLDFDKMSADRNTFRDQTVYFDYDKANVRPSEVSKLERVASEMKSSTPARPCVRRPLRRAWHGRIQSLTRRAARAKCPRIPRPARNEPDHDPDNHHGRGTPGIPGHDEAAWSKNRRGELVLLTPSAGRHRAERSSSYSLTA